MFETLKFINSKIVIVALAVISCCICDPQNGFLFDDSNSTFISLNTNATVNASLGLNILAPRNDSNSNQGVNNSTSGNVLLKKGIKSKLGKLLNIGESSNQTNSTQSNQSQQLSMQIPNATAQQSDDLSKLLQNTSFNDTQLNYKIDQANLTTYDKPNITAQLDQHDNKNLTQANRTDKESLSNETNSNSNPSGSNIKLNETKSDQSSDSIRAHNSTNSLLRINSNTTFDDSSKAKNTTKSQDSVDPSLRIIVNSTASDNIKKDNRTENEPKANFNLTADFSLINATNSLNSTQTTGNSQPNITLIQSSELNSTIHQLIDDAMSQYSNIIQNTTSQQSNAINVQLLELIDLEVEKFTQKVEGKYNDFLNWLNSIDMELQYMITTDQNATQSAAAQ